MHHQVSAEQTLCCNAVVVVVVASDALDPRHEVDVLDASSVLVDSVAVGVNDDAGHRRRVQDRVGEGHVVEDRGDRHLPMQGNVAEERRLVVMVMVVVVLVVAGIELVLVMVVLIVVVVVAVVVGMIRRFVDVSHRRVVVVRHRAHR